MGITFNDFFENIYCVIFSPRKFFEREDIKISLRLALFTVMIIAAVVKIASGVSDGSIREKYFILLFILNIFGAVCIWFFTSLFFEYIAKIFDRGGNPAKILYYTAFAPVPYMFFAPLNLIKNIGDFGYILSSNIELIIYLWVIFLYAYSLRAAYKISFPRAFMLIFLPFIASFFALYWMIGIIHKIWYIFSI